MYHIKCDDYPLFDPRDDDLIVESPKVNLEVNTVCEGAFTIHHNHPYFGKLKKLKSVFEVSDDIGVIFRGRMTNNSYDFHNSTFVDLEGAMAYFNDSKVRPYSFPEDWLEDAGYITAEKSGNVIEFFLNWLINQHNAQVQEFQRFKLGNVTVTDPNNYLSRSDSSYPSTWEVLKSKLFDSALGGFLCIRYEADGNYIDYLSEFELTNTQEIVFGENLLDLKTDSDATTTYSAVIAIGATIETETTDEEGNTETIKTTVTLESLPDGDITDDIVKEGDMIYSRSAREAYGLIIAPVKETTWDDVTDANNLLTKSVTFLASDGIMLSETVETTAADLHFSDEQVQSFRIYRNVKVRSDPHGHNGIYQLSKLGLDLQNPQNTKISVGSTKRTLTDINSEKESDTIQRIESAEKDIEENRTDVTEVKNQLIINTTQIINNCESIIMSALESYVETSNYEEFKRTVQSQLEILADEISMNFTTTTEQVTNVDGDLQSKFTELYKYIKLSAGTAITIGSSDSAITLEIDNKKGIAFKKNGVQFGLWDGENFYTGNIVVEVNERAQFGNFAFVPRSDGSLAFLKVDGENAERPTLVSISATYNGGSVTAGTSLNSLTDITVIATYSDNSTETVDNYYLSGEINVGTNTITVSYGGKTTSFTVVGESLPNKLVSISATYSGGTVQPGTTLGNLTGITVTARYSDGSTEPVTGYTLSGSIEPGSNTITVSYEGKTTTFTVYCESAAERTLEYISATYSGGSVPVGTLVESLSGITVTAHWSDGSTSIVGGASRSGTINEGENIITITYKGKTTTITVVGVASASNDIVLGDKTNCVVYAWLTNTTAGASVQYASDVRAVDGNVELVNPMNHTVYMQYSGVANDYTVLLDKYVKSFNGDIYYIDPDSTYTHSTDVTAYVKENIVYHSAHLVSVAE